MKISKFLGGLLVLAAVTGLAYAAQFQYGTVNVATGVAALTNTTVTSTSGTAFDIPQGVPMTFMPNFGSSGTGTSNVIFGFNLSSDGTNFTTTLPLSITNACNGATGVTGGVLVPAATLTGWKKGRLDQVTTTQTTGVFITNIITGYFY